MSIMLTQTSSLLHFTVHHNIGGASTYVTENACNRPGHDISLLEICPVDLYFYWRVSVDVKDDHLVLFPYDSRMIQGFPVAVAQDVPNGVLKVVCASIDAHTTSTLHDMCMCA